MNLDELQKRNEKFRIAAARITELIPGINLVPYTSLIIRSSKKIDSIFPELLKAETEIRFNAAIEKLEDEMDEVIFSLDQLHLYANKKKVKPVSDFVKYGYDLLSLYSFACDKIIERRIKEEA